MTDDYGPRASLGVLARLQQEQRVNMSVNDHQMAHVVGRDTAKDYGSNFKAFDLCPTTFNYGCSHGFFEYVLARTPDARKAATTICESLNPKTNLLIAGFTCYHGVGHGIMMAQGYNVQNSLKECNTMPAAKGQGRLLARRLHGERERGHAGTCFAGVLQEVGTRSLPATRSVTATGTSASSTTPGG